MPECNPGGYNISATKNPSALERFFGVQKPAHKPDSVLMIIYLDMTIVTSSRFSRDACVFLVQISNSLPDSAVTASRIARFTLVP